MKISIPGFLKNNNLRNATAVSIVLIVIAFARAYVALRDINHLLIIHLTGIPGSSFAGEKFDIYGLLISGLLILILNILLVHVFYRRERFFSYIFAIASMVFALLLLIAVTGIMALNSL